MPNSISTAFPNSTKTARIPTAVSVPLNAVARRSAAVWSAVSAANAMATSSGPIVAKKVVKAIRAISNIRLP